MIYSLIGHTPWIFALNTGLLISIGWRPEDVRWYGAVGITALVAAVMQTVVRGIQKAVDFSIERYFSIEREQEQQGGSVRQRRPLGVDKTGRT